eukprot:6205392-Pleurochrysis_carterae.AAC.2
MFQAASCKERFIFIFQAGSGKERFIFIFQAGSGKEGLERLMESARLTRPKGACAPRLARLDASAICHRRAGSAFEWSWTRPWSKFSSCAPSSSTRYSSLSISPYPRFTILRACTSEQADCRSFLHIAKCRRRLRGSALMVWETEAARPESVGKSARMIWPSKHCSPGCTSGALANRASFALLSAT